MTLSRPLAQSDTDAYVALFTLMIATVKPCAAEVNL